MGHSNSPFRNAENGLRLPLLAWAILGLAIAAIPASAQTVVSNPPPFLTTNVYTGPASQRLNIVVFGDGYTSNQMALFQTHVTNVVVNYLFTKVPYNTYAPYFNVFSVFTASLESGSDHPEYGTSKDTYFDSTYNTYSIQRLVTFKQSGRVYTLLSQFLPDYNVIIGIVNDSTYGGSGGSLAVTSIHGSAPDIMLHEVGHSFGGLADEYEDITPGYSPYESVNCTAQTNRSLIKWAAWIDGSTPIPTPENSGYSAVAGLFEGCMYTNANWYRPHYNSFMRALGQPTGQINSDQIVKRIYKTSPDHIEPYTGFTPSNTNLNIGEPTNLTFTVTPMQPASSTMSVTWFLDGTNLVNATGTNLILSSYDIGNGSHVISNRVFDTTPLVRIYTNSSFPVNPLAKSAAWRLSVSNQTVTIEASAGPHGTIAPAGTVVLRTGSGTNFAVRADPFHHIASLLTNGMAAPVANATNVVVAWNAVTVASTVRVDFAENVVTNDTPEWWLARYYPGTNDLTGAAMSDTDTDGVPAWAEYAADTDPTNAASLFFLAGLSNGPAFSTFFQSSSNRFYTLEHRTNLCGGQWTAVGVQSNKAGTGGALEMTDTNVVSPGYYRVRANAP